MRPLLVGIAVLAAARGAAAVCVGDCSGTGTVVVADLVRGVNIALGNAAPASCAALDADGNGAVAINELIEAVSNALLGCDAVAPTPSPSPTPGATTPTATPGSAGPCGDTTSVETFFTSNRGFLRVYRTGGSGELFDLYADPAGYRLQILTIGAPLLILNPTLMSVTIAVEAEDEYDDLPNEVNVIFNANPAQPQVGYVGVLQCDKQSGEWFLSIAAANNRFGNFASFTTVAP